MKKFIIVPFFFILIGCGSPAPSVDDILNNASAGKYEKGQEVQFEGKISEVINGNMVFLNAKDGKGVIAAPLQAGTGLNVKVDDKVKWECKYHELYFSQEQNVYGIIVDQCIPI